MGYFSSLALDREEREDDSVLSAECQLKQRLEDLRCRLEEIRAGDIPRRRVDEGVRLNDDEIRYATAEYFVRAVDVERAIELALRDLKRKYGIDAEELGGDEPAPEPPPVGREGLGCRPDADRQQNAA